MDPHSFNTAPVTPLRSGRYSRLSLVNGPRSASRIHDIHLPPNELTAIHDLNGNSSIRRRRSTLTRPVSRHDGVLTPGRDKVGSRFQSPTRKRRRSSIVVESSGGDAAFNTGYAGPITMDYLRFLCKITIEEKCRESILPTKTIEQEDSQINDLQTDDMDIIKSEPPVETRTVDTYPENNQELGSPRGSARESYDYDRSLLLPTNIDELLKSPETRSQKLDSDPFLEVEDTKPERQYSYLERILAAQALKKKKKRSVDVQVTTEEAEIVTNVVKIDQDGSNKHQAEHQDNSIEPQDELDIRDEMPALDPDPLSPYQEEPPYEDGEDGLDHDELDMPEQDPEIQRLEAQDEIPIDESDPQLDNSMNDALVQEEYILDDGSRRNSLLETIEPEITPHSPPPRVKSTNKKKVSSSIRDQFVSKQMIKGMVYTLNPIPKDLEKKHKRLRLDSQAVESIQKQSDAFLDQLTSDLASYAEHRGGHSINVRDVMLYMNRLKYPGDDGTRVNTASHFSDLARTYLPLESLIQLENGLKDAYRTGGVEPSSQVTHKYFDESVVYFSDSSDENDTEDSEPSGDKDFLP